METELKIFINGIRKKTGLNLSVYGTDGQLLVGDNCVERIANTEIDGVFSDVENDRTLFSIKYKNKNLIGSIEGANGAEKNYAYLIAELAENAFIKDLKISREEFQKSVLMGELNQAQIAKYATRFGFRDTPVFVMVISVENYPIGELKEILQTWAEVLDFSVVIDDEQLALVKFNQMEGVEYQSPTEYAEFLEQSIYEETGKRAKIAIGGVVKSLAEISTSFSQATTASRIGKTINAKGQIHSFREYMLVKMLEDLPKHKLNENLHVLLDNSAKEIFNDEEMLSTAEEFLENSLNVSETSRKLYLHRNTLTYRLDKIEKLTGLNIRKFSDAVTFRLIMILSELIR